MDLLPTFAKLAGTSAAGDRIIDGKDIVPILRGDDGARSPHEAFYYYQRGQLQAVRSGRWKLYLPLPDRPAGINRGSRHCMTSGEDLGETTKSRRQKSGNC